MNFSEFANRVKPFCGDNKKPHTFIVELVDAIMEEPNDDEAQAL